VSPDATIDALYALKICEISLSPNSCVIVNEKPEFLSVKELLKYSTDHTVDLLRMELEIKLTELGEDWHFSSLEKIFFEERIYRQLENDAADWEELLTDIERAFEPFRLHFRREITRDDIVKLTEKPVRKISKFDVKKADEHIKGVENEMAEIQNKLAHLIEYAIDYFLQIKKKYVAGRERKSEIRNFENIDAKQVVAANVKLYVNREEGFVGTGLKKDEFVCDCSDLDDIIVFLEDGTFSVAKIAEKVFFGQGIIYVAVFKKNDERTVYNVVYQDGKVGSAYVKRFAVTKITRERRYDITKGSPNSKILYFTANPNGEAEHIRVFLKNKPNLRRLQYDFDFSTLTIKGRSSMGNIISRNPIKKIMLENEGVSTLSARKIWFDESIKRLNTEERGLYIGEFSGEDKLLIIYKSGHYKLTNFDLSNRYDDDLLLIEKYDFHKIISAVYYDGEQKFVYLKRFKVEENDKKNLFITENSRSEFLEFSMDYRPQLNLTFEKKNGKDLPDELINVEEFIGEKSFKARGKRLSVNKIKKYTWLEPLPYIEEVKEINEELEETDIPDDVVSNEMKNQELDSIPFPIVGTDKLEDGEIVQGELF
jgi:topoisomerase-4 subunit A